jgi:hypothetical protein
MGSVVHQRVELAFAIQHRAVVHQRQVSEQICWIGLLTLQWLHDPAQIVCVAPGEERAGGTERCAGWVGQTPPTLAQFRVVGVE